MIDLLKDAFTQLRDLVSPKKYFAWQTILLLSLFSWLMAIIAEGSGAEELTVEFLSTGSWLFLTVAVWWGLWKNPPTLFDQRPALFGYTLGPWITGAVMCIFLFNPWTDERLRLAVTFWPIISTLIAVLPQFFSWKLDKIQTPAPPDRQRLLLLVLANLLLTCWLVFYFRLQDWFNAYPSLMAESSGQSAFVYQVRAADPNSSQGIPLVSSAAEVLEAELDGVPWPRVERWLLNLDDGIDKIASNIAGVVAEERLFWSLDAPPPTAVNDGYRLRLRANWVGPTAGPGHYYEKVCAIDQERPTAPPDPGAPREVTPVAVVSCESDVQRVERDRFTA